jgi:hypothetical protein
MPAIHQRNNLGDLLKYEAPNLYSRQTGTLAAGQNLALGTVLGKRSADDALQAFDPAATDGSEVAVAVLAFDCDASLIDRDDAVYIARQAIVARDAVIWPSGITAAQRASALTQLESLGILVRDSA